MKGEPMTNDPSNTVTSTSITPAPVGNDSDRAGGNPCLLPMGEPDNLSPAPDALDTPQPDMVKTVDDTTFEIFFHFSQTSRETFEDKVLRLIRSDPVTSKK